MDLNYYYAIVRILKNERIRIQDLSTELIWYKLRSTPAGNMVKN